jgi:GTPase SAR1 family protein
VVCLQTEEPAELKVLVLGLDGVGKSSIVHSLSGCADSYDHRKSDSFNVVNLDWSKRPLSLWESK